MIYTVTLNPALDKTVTISGFRVDQVNRIETMQTDAGGKGINVSRWVNMLGGESVAMGILGGSAGKYVHGVLEQEGIATDFVWSNHNTRTNLKVIDPSEGTHTDINEPGARIGADTLAEVYDKLAARVQAGDIVVLAGKTPPGIPETVLADWTEMMGARGAFVFADVDGMALEAVIARAPYLIKPNLVELEALLGTSLPTERDVADAAKSLLAGGIHTVVVSLGEKGAVFAQQEELLFAKGLSVAVGSTVGAGDAMVAALAFAKEQKMSLHEAAALALAAGSASVMQPGTMVADRDLVYALREQVHPINM